MASGTSLHQSGCASRRTIISSAVIPYAQLLDLTRPHQHISALSRPHPRPLSRLLSASSTLCSLTECRDVHWALAPRRAITDPLRCQAYIEQLLAAAGPEQSPPCVRVTAKPRTNTPGWRLRSAGSSRTASISHVTYVLWLLGTLANR